MAKYVLVCEQYGEGSDMSYSHCLFPQDVFENNFEVVGVECKPKTKDLEWEMYEFRENPQEGIVALYYYFHK
jgi:hypothetical protein